MLFEKIIGNDHIKAYLNKLLLEKKVPNALLFSGLEGIGKSLFAKALAAYLLKDDPNTDPYFIKRLMDNNHPDLHLYYPEGKSSMHSIASMRALCEEVFQEPFEAKAKVFIIHDASRMLPSSANALLKTLEEPTLDSYIILLTSSVKDLLPTILSRCMKIYFDPIKTEKIAAYLQENQKISEEVAKQIGSFSLGSIKRAIEFSQSSYEEKSKLFIEIVSQKLPYILLQKKLIDLEKLYLDEEEKKVSYQDVETLLSQVLMWHRDLNLVKQNVDPKFLFFSTAIASLQKQAYFKTPTLERVHQLIDNVRLALLRNVKLRVCLEELFMELSTE